MTPADWWTLPGAPPRFATRRDPAFRTEGRRVGYIAQALGTPLMPWQQYAADVAGELNDDGTTYRYQVVVVSVPRQSGKTTLMRAVGVDRCISREGCGVFYTAQTGKDARERWQDLVKALKASPLSALIQVRAAAGSERVVFPNGSMFRCFAPVPTSLHGYTPPLVMLDEAFAHTTQAGDDLEGAIGPAQITLPHRQLWIVSTRGTADSGFLNKWLEAGRAGAPGVALLDWGAPDGVDVYDPAVWPTFHPAMHTGLITADAIAGEAARLPRSEFVRAYGNRDTRTQSNVIPTDAWERLKHDGERQSLERVTSPAYAFDVMHDRSAAALVAVWIDPAGERQAKVVRSGPGTSWLVPAVQHLHDAGARSFAFPDDSPARETADELARLHIHAQAVGGRDLADSWGFLMRHIHARTIRHDGTDALAVAAANVATRPSRDGATASRRHSAGDVTPLTAVMVASWWLDHRPASGGLDYGFAS